MAAVNVTSDNVRVDDAESANGYGNIGGGPGGAAEAPFAYQGALLYNRRVTSGTGAGFEYVPTNDGGSSLDMTTARRKTWMVKCVVSDYGGLDPADGVFVRIGSTSSNYFAYVLAGTDSPAANFAAYRDIGGLLVIPVDPNESAAYNDTGKDLGTPNLSAINYFALLAAFSVSSAKSENVGLDAIDIGSGLYLVGGDGGDADGVWQDFADYDGNTVANRFGYVRNADGGGILAFGELRIGTSNDSTGTATVFADNNAVITWLDHLAGADFSKVAINLGSATTAITDGSLHIGAGDTTNVDSRPSYNVSGTSGTFTFTGTLRNFAGMELTSACTITGAVIEVSDILQNNATITGSIVRTSAPTSVATILNPNFSNIDDTSFIQTGAGHALRISTAGAYSFDNLRFSGYGADASDAAAIDVIATSGIVTINILNGGDTPTVKTAGATVVIVNAVAVSVLVIDGTTGLAVEDARVYLEAATGGPLPFEDSVTITRLGTTATVAHTAHGLDTGDKVVIRGANESAYTGIQTITVTSANAYTYTVIGSPTTPATGTIEATAVILDGLSSIAGLVENTGFNYVSDQPVSGRVRKGTISPLYKTQPISGTITSGGFSVTAPLVSDE